MASLVPTVIFEDFGWKRLLPLTYIRASFQLICGMQDLLSRVRRLAGSDSGLSIWCRGAIAELVAEQTKLPANVPLPDTGVLLLNGRALWHALPEARPAESSWVGTVAHKPSSGNGSSSEAASTPAGPTSASRIVCIYADAQLAARLTPDVLQDEVWMRTVLANVPTRDLTETVRLLDGSWDVVLAGAAILPQDFAPIAELSGGPAIQGQVDAGSHILAPENVFIGEGARIKPCVVIDAEEGPVYIGRNVRILPHSYIQGPAYIGDGTLIQAGGTVRDGAYIGPVCKIGGEIDASIIHGYSNKQHDGFLGHSYVGSWVNIAAACVNSDLKNTYGTVRVPVNGYEIDTHEMFVGSVIGDHSKVGINVSIPTGAVISFCSSVFSPRSPKFVSSFSWMTGGRLERYDPQRALAVARKVMARRKMTMTAAEERVFLGVLSQALAIERTPDADAE